ncbi:RidA family protein [Actinomadura fulvescens]|uniref:RidA family protein n=1 Tax=Actinomadura fulvescens TaxID=46160 RepID=A0ABP6CU43_9ACTN
MSGIGKRLTDAGLALPEPMTPPPGLEFNFELVRISGQYAYLSGHGPYDGTHPLVQGTVGAELSVEQGYAAAGQAALSMLASLQQVLGDLDRVTNWLKADVSVNAVPGFAHTTLVANGFSDLILNLWGPAGRHARSAPGVAALPFNIPVVVDAVVEITG